MIPFGEPGTPERLRWLKETPAEDFLMLWKPEQSPAAWAYRAGYRYGSRRMVSTIVFLMAIAFFIGVAAGRVTAAPRPGQDALVSALASATGGGLPDRTGAPQPKLAAPTAAPHNANALVHTGIASTYGEGWDGWTAWPAGPGYTLRVCGQAACVTVISNDAGPSLAMQRQGRIIDLDARTFERISGQPWRKVGLANVSVTVLKVPR